MKRERIGFWSGVAIALAGLLALGYTQIPAGLTGTQLRSEIDNRLNGTTQINPKVPNASATGQPVAYGQPCGGNLTGNFPNCSSAGDYHGGSGQVDIHGTKTNGIDMLDRVNVNGVANAKAYGALGSTTTANATCASGNAAVTVNAIGDFAIGQKVKIDHAGAASDAVTPTALAVEPQSYGLNSQPTSDITKIAGNGGGCHTDVTTKVGHNTACNVNHTYAIVGVSANGGWSAPTSNVSTAVGPNTLSMNNNINVTWTGNAADIAYIIYHCQGAACTPTLEAVVPQKGSLGATAQAFRDMKGNVKAQDETYGATKQAGATPRDLWTTIDNVVGTTVTLHDAPGQTGTFVMRHSDDAGVQAAIDSFCSHTGTGGTSAGHVYSPGATTYVLTKTVSMYGCYGITFEGAGKASDGGMPTRFEWHGPIGGTMFNLNKTGDTHLGKFTAGVWSGSGNTPGVVIDIDNYNTSGGGDSVTTKNISAESVDLTNAAIGLRMANVGSANEENCNFRNVYISNPSTGKGGIHGWEVSGGGQTYVESFQGGQIWGDDAAIWTNKAGSIAVRDTDFELGQVSYWADNYNGGQSDGVVTFDHCYFGTDQYLFYGNATSGGSQIVIRGSSYIGGAGPNNFFMQLDRRGTLMDNNFCNSGVTACAIGGGARLLSSHNTYSDATPFHTGNGDNTSGFDAAFSYVEIDDLVNNGVSAVATGLKFHDQIVHACNDMGTVTTGQTLDFSKVSCQKLTTATTGLTYTLSTTGVKTDQVVEIDSYITGAITGPLWATSSGAFKWVGGAAPTSSGTSGYKDVLVLKFNGTDWLELSRALAER